MGLNSYKDLIVWQKSFQLVKEVYRVTKFFPKVEQYGLTNQIRRAAVAIPSNIAEGFSRRSRKEFAQFIKEFAQFINIAFSSSSELETQLLLAKDLNLAPIEKFTSILNLLKEIRKMLNSLSKKLKSY
jgi:four helix bundle protein